MSEQDKVNGIIVLDKPTGYSSNQAMSNLKKLLNQRKMGFLGTLDPLATGVLPVFLGKSTKLIHLFEGLDKSYRVTMKLGVTTDTLDSEGQVQQVRELGDLSSAQVVRETLSMAGNHVQRTPDFSAIKINGVPAYKLARRGEAVPDRPRNVKLYDLVVEDVSLPEVTFRVSCTAGTYMRVLVADIGERLGVGAHITALRRLHSGCLFTDEISFTLDQIRYAVDEGSLKFLRNPAEFLTAYASVLATETMVVQLKHGQPVTLALEMLHPAENLAGFDGSDVPVKILGPDGELLAIGAGRQEDQLVVFQPKKVLI